MYPLVGCSLVIGIAVLVEGTIVAWGAESATPLLIIGSVLVALGLVDWVKLRAGYKEWWLELLRASERIAGAAERDDVPEDAKAELAEVAAEVEAAAEGRKPPSVRATVPPEAATGSSVMESSSFRFQPQRPGFSITRSMSDNRTVQQQQRRLDESVRACSSRVSRRSTRTTSAVRTSQHSTVATWSSGTYGAESALSSTAADWSERRIHLPAGCCDFLNEFLI